MPLERSHTDLGGRKVCTSAFCCLLLRRGLARRLGILKAIEALTLTYQSSRGEHHNGNDQKPILPPHLDHKLCFPCPSQPRTNSTLFEHHLNPSTMTRQLTMARPVCLDLEVPTSRLGPKETMELATPIRTVLIRPRPLLDDWLGKTSWVIMRNLSQ